MSARAADRGFCGIAFELEADECEMAEFKFYYVEFESCLLNEAMAVLLLLAPKKVVWAPLVGVSRVNPEITVRSTFFYGRFPSVTCCGLRSRLLKLCSF